MVTWSAGRVPSCLSRPSHPRPIVNLLTVTTLWRAIISRGTVIRLVRRERAGTNAHRSPSDALHQGPHQSHLLIIPAHMNRAYSDHTMPPDPSRRERGPRPRVSSHRGLSHRARMAPGVSPLPSSSSHASRDRTRAMVSSCSPCVWLQTFSIWTWSWWSDHGDVPWTTAISIPLTYRSRDPHPFLRPHPRTGACHGMKS